MNASTFDTLLERPTSQRPAKNHLIAELPEDDRAALEGACQPFDFASGDILCDAGGSPRSMEFVDSGVVSAMAIMSDGRSVESYMIGREGVTQSQAMEVPVQCYARLVGQIAGSGRRIGIDNLRSLARARPALRQALAAYGARRTNELEQSTACNALHSCEERFAKWLLRCHDRTDGDVLHLTQEFLASMLGSQRTTVNEAAQHLQKSGAIQYIRAKITVRDRRALEDAACECYGAHRRMLDDLRQGSSSDREFVGVGA